MRGAILEYVKGFFEDGKPQSSARLCAILTTVGAIVIGLVGVCRKWDSSSIVLALSAGGVGSLWQRKSGSAPPAAEENKG